MGSGKSSLGRKLAARLGWRFVDTDSEVERAEGAQVADIMHYNGEEYFRRCEQRALHDTAKAEDAVIATGGGLPVWGDNMEFILASGVSVYISRTPENIVSRLSPYGRYKRPKFRGLDDAALIAFIRTNMAEREPVYMKANMVLDCTAVPDAMAVGRIAGWLGAEYGIEQGEAE